MKKQISFLVIAFFLTYGVADASVIFNSYDAGAGSSIIYNSESMSTVFDIGTNGSLSGTYYWAADDLDFLDVSGSCGADEEDAFLNLYSANADYTGLLGEHRIYTHTGGPMEGVYRTGTVAYTTNGTYNHTMLLMRCVSELQDGVGIRANSGSFTGQFLDANNKIYTGKPKFCLTTTAEERDTCFPAEPEGPSFYLAWPVSSTASTNFQRWYVKPNNTSSFSGRIGVEYALSSSTLASSPTWDDYVEASFVPGSNIFINNTNARLRYFGIPASTEYYAKIYWSAYGTTTRTYGDETYFVINNSVFVLDNTDAILAGATDNVVTATSTESLYCSFYNSGQCVLDVGTALGTIMLGSPAFMNDFFEDSLFEIKQGFPFRYYFELQDTISSSITNATTTGGQLAYPILNSGVSIPLNYGSSTLEGVVGATTKNTIFALIKWFLWSMVAYVFFKLVIL